MWRVFLCGVLVAWGCGAERGVADEPARLAEAPPARVSTEPELVASPRVVEGRPVGVLSVGQLEYGPAFGGEVYGRLEWVSARGERALMRWLPVERRGGATSMRVDERLWWVDTTRGVAEAVGEGAAWAQGSEQVVWRREGALWRGGEGGEGVFVGADAVEDGAECLGPRGAHVERDRVWSLREGEVIAQGTRERVVYAVQGWPWRVEGLGGGWGLLYSVGAAHERLRCVGECSFGQRRGWCPRELNRLKWTQGPVQLTVLAPTGMSHAVSRAMRQVAWGMFWERGAEHVWRAVDGARLKLPSGCSPLEGLWGARALLWCGVAGYRLWDGRDEGVAVAGLASAKVWQHSAAQSAGGHMWVGVVSEGRMGRVRLTDGLIELGPPVYGEVAMRGGPWISAGSGRVAVMDVGTGESSVGEYEGEVAVVAWGARVVAGLPGQAWMGHWGEDGCGVVAMGTRQATQLGALYGGPFMRACVRRGRP